VKEIRGEKKVVESRRKIAEGPELAGPGLQFGQAIDRGTDSSRLCSWSQAAPTNGKNILPSLSLSLDIFFLVAASSAFDYGCCSIVNCRSVTRR